MFRFSRNKKKDSCWNRENVSNYWILYFIDKENIAKEFTKVLKEYYVVNMENSTSSTSLAYMKA